MQSISPSVMSEMSRTSPSGQKKNLSSRERLTPSTITMDETTALGAQGNSVLDSLAQLNSRPKFVSATGVREDTIMEKLLRDGILIKSRIYSESGKIAYFLARNRVGDCFVIQIDDPEYQKTFPGVEFSGLDDIQLQSPVISFPQMTTIGLDECLEYEICGTAFTCNGSICIAGRSGSEVTSLKKETFVFNSTKSVLTGMLGNNPMPYPIVRLTILLKNPRVISDKISKIVQIMAKKTFEQLKDPILLEEASLLKHKAEVIQQFVSTLQKDFNEQINRLEHTFHEMSTIDPEQMTDEGHAFYDKIGQDLLRKKELRSLLMTKLGDVRDLAKTVASINQEIDSLMGPVIEQTIQSLEV